MPQSDPTQRGIKIPVRSAACMQCAVLSARDVNVLEK